MSTPEFMPMTVGQILDNTFRLYKRNFARFIAIVAVVQVPVALLLVIMGASIFGVAAASRDTSGGPPVAVIALAVVVWLVTLFLNVVAQNLCRGALTKSVSECYLGNDVSVGEVYRFALPKLWSLIGAGILVGLAVTGGIMLCVVPGVIFGLWFMLTTPSIIVENRGATDAMSRSKGLVAGNLGRAFVLGLLVFLMNLILGLVCGFGGNLLARALAVATPITGIIINQGASLIANVLVAPIGAAAYILLYYDLRIRKEAFDLEMLAASMGAPGASADAGQPTA